MVLKQLQDNGLKLTDDIDALDYRGTDWKSMNTADWFQFCKANKAWQEPGISWEELDALHEACELWKDRPATILETGQCYGTTTRYFAVRNIKYGGELYSIEYKVRSGFKKAMEELGLWDKFHTVEGHTQKIFWDRKIDILFIDSEHALSDALGEYMKYRVFMEGGGIVGFHDAENCYGVRRTIEIIQEIDDLELISSSGPDHGYGIKIFRVKSMNTAQMRINEFKK